MNRLLALLLILPLLASGQVTTNPGVTGVPAPQSAVAITGGTINGTPIGGTTPAAGAFTTITGSSVQTLPNQPGFSATASGAPANVTGDGTQYTVVFATEQFDAASNFNNTTGVFTAPVTGVYVFGMALSLNGIAAAHTIVQATLVTTATSYLFTTSKPFTIINANGEYSVGGTVVTKMSAGDTASIILAGYNSTKLIGVGANSYFTGTLLH